MVTIREKTSCLTQQTDDWEIERQICIKCSNSWKREVSKRHFKEPEDETDENRSLQEGTAYLGELVGTFRKSLSRELSVHSGCVKFDVVSGDCSQLSSL